MPQVFDLTVFNNIFNNQTLGGWNFLISFIILIFCCIFISRAIKDIMLLALPMYAALVLMTPLKLNTLLALMCLVVTTIATLTDQQFMSVIYSPFKAMQKSMDEGNISRTRLGTNRLLNLKRQNYRRNEALSMEKALHDTLVKAHQKESVRAYHANRAVRKQIAVKNIIDNAKQRRFLRFIKKKNESES